ncbi:MAG: hypothetical protein A2Y65_12005 [Deltaproteobacteria bacterium RBG_13_52_11]|nr:MAG: hypothetical protein A2Y65_12005 [Deltaproteobacteria bacterium RBG_13_52_11]
MIRRWFVFACVLVLIAWLAGCASVTVTPIKSTDLETPGVRYYESEPYLLVTKDVPKTASATPSYTIQLVWLPNYNRGYAVKTTSGLGTANGSVTLANGWQLSVLGAIVDSKIPDTIDAVTNLVKALGISVLTKEGTEAPPPTIPLEAGLYRLNFDKDKGSFQGLERVF